MEQQDDFDSLWSKKEEFTVHCDVCSRSFSGLVPYKEHLKSKKHNKCILRRKLEENLKSNLASESKTEQSGDIDDILMQKPFAVCAPCSKEFSGPETYYQHLSSKVHTNKVLTNKLLSKLKENDKAEGNQAEANQDCYEKELLKNLESDDSETELECEECRKVFSGVVPFLIHMKSKVHQRKLLKIKMLEELKHTNLELENDEDDVLACRLCRFAFSGIESLSLHLKTKKHLHKLEVQKFKKEQEELKSNQQTPKDTIPQNPDGESSDSKDVPVQTLTQDECGDEPKVCDNYQISDATVAHHPDIAKSESGLEMGNDALEGKKSENYKAYKKLFSGVCDS